MTLAEEPALFFFAVDSTKELFCSLSGGEKAGIGRKPAEECRIFAGFYVWSVALLKTGAGVWNPYFEWTNRQWRIARTEGRKMEADDLGLLKETN